MIIFQLIAFNPSAVCVSIEVTEFENGTKGNTDVYNIAKKTFNGATQKPIYKLFGGAMYILYFPDAYGWRITEIDDDGNFDDFSYESKNVIYY